MRFIVLTLLTISMYFYTLILMIKVEHLSKTFRSTKKFPGFLGSIKGLFTREYTEKKAIDDISFSIAPGEIVGYIGSNGAGKSTTIKVMTGILTPTAGTVFVDGIEPYKNREINAKKIGVVFGQRTQLWWDLPLNETYSLLKRIYEVSDADFTERMEFFRNVLGLDEFIMQPVRTLSLGQRMKADIAASLLHNPKILFLDEPTIGLDVMVKEKVREAIKLINEKYNTTIILTTHDLQDIEELCKRIIIIDDGKIVYNGTIGHLREEYGEETFMTVKLDSTDVDSKNIESLFDNQVSAKITNEGAVRIAFSNKKYTPTKILKTIIGKYEVADFTLEGTDIEEIVKKIYRNEVAL